MTPIVVKVGGSHALDPSLRLWMEALASSRHPLLVVPGGGPFADAVREAQQPMGFSDRAGHRMAILAMAQFAEALADRFGLPLVAADSDAMRVETTAVWTPLATAFDDATLAPSWDLTSDSIAAWLARRLAASALILVKRTLPAGVGSPEDASRAGLVDPLFPAMVDGLAAPVWLAGPEARASLAALFDDLHAPSLPGMARLLTAQRLRRAG